MENPCTVLFCSSNFFALLSFVWGLISLGQSQKVFTRAYPPYPILLLRSRFCAKEMINDVLFPLENVTV